MKSREKFFRFTEEDDEAIRRYVEKFGDKQWSSVSKAIFYEKEGKFISPKACSGRWENHLSEKISRKEWTAEEDKKLL